MDYFSNLPNEILLEIFEYGRILHLTLVCKKFNELISKSPSLMKKANLLISDKALLSEIKKSKRNYQGVDFRFNYKIGLDCLDVISVFDGIKHLEMRRCIVPADLFLKMLHSLPHLESISIYTTYLKNKEELKSFDPPQLTKLKNLNFRNSDEMFLAILQNSSIENLYLAYPAQYPKETLVNFMHSQPRIKIIDYFHVSPIDGLLMVLLVQKLESLKKLHIQCDQLEMDSIRNLELMNTFVRSLNLFGNPAQAGDLPVILNYFKKLTELEIEMNSMLEAGNVLQLQQLAPNLESLIITHCSGDYFNHIQLRNLKHLKITDGSWTVDEWTRFAIRNPGITALTIKDESITNEAFTTICLEFRNLQRLELNYDPQRLTPDILDFICDGMFPANIRHLKITQRSSPSENFLTLTDEHKEELKENAGFGFIFN